LHHWNISVTYHTLSIEEIKASVESADTLNSFSDDDTFDQVVDELVNEAMQIEWQYYFETIVVVNETNSMKDCEMLLYYEVYRQVTAKMWIFYQLCKYLT